jgi:hypothetical protein
LRYSALNSPFLGKYTKKSDIFDENKKFSKYSRSFAIFAI